MCDDHVIVVVVIVVARSGNFVTIVIRITLQVCTEGCNSAIIGHPVCLLKDILTDSNLPVTC